MTDREFWAAVYIACIKAGKAPWEAKAAADEAVRTYQNL